MMRREFEVFDSCRKALPSKEFNITYSFINKEKKIIEIAEAEDKASVLVSGQEYPAALVKSKFLKLNYSHIEYVIGCMGKNITKVCNIKAYLLAALFNAGSTMGS